MARGEQRPEVGLQQAAGVIRQAGFAIGGMDSDTLAGLDQQPGLRAGFKRPWGWNRQNCTGGRLQRRRFHRRSARSQLPPTHQHPHHQPAGEIEALARITAGLAQDPAIPEGRRGLHGNGHRPRRLQEVQHHRRALALAPQHTHGRPGGGRHPHRQGVAPRRRGGVSHATRRPADH